MALPVRMSISLPFFPGNIEQIVARAQWAEAEGFDGAWLADVGAVDAFTLAGILLARTERLRYGMAVVPAYTRTPAVMAASCLTLAGIGPGRFVMGLGSSSHAMIEGWHGIPFDKPLTRVRETAQALRAMLAGEKVMFSGETLRTHGYVQPGPVDVPIYLAGLRPKMLEMAAEVGDGVVLNNYPLAALPRMMEHIRIGAERAGRRLEDVEVVSRLHAIVTDDEAAARESYRKRFAPYFATPVYNRFLAWCGYQEAADAIEQGWQEKERAKTSGALSDALVDQIAVIGSAEKCREIVREHIRLGITTPVINPVEPAALGETYGAFTREKFPV